MSMILTSDDGDELLSDDGLLLTPDRDYGAVQLRHAFLVKFNFLSGPYYVWQGFRPLPAGGQIWQPVGPQATVEEVEDPVADSAPQVVLRVSGVDTSLLAKALSESNEIRGQMAFIYDLFFDADWQPAGDISVYAVVRMDTLKITNARQQDGSRNQVIEITAEHFLTNGPNPPYGRYSNEDQWARQGNNDDKYFEFMGANQNRRQRWPTF